MLLVGVGYIVCGFVKILELVRVISVSSGDVVRHDQILGSEMHFCHLFVNIHICA